MTNTTKVALQVGMLVVLASVLAITETSTESIQQLVTTVVWLISG